MTLDTNSVLAWSYQVDINTLVDTYLEPSEEPQ